MKTTKKNKQPQISFILIGDAIDQIDQHAESNARVFHAPEGYRRLTINLPEELHKKLRLAAIECDSTATVIIESLLNEVLN